jgi:nucleotide-binding universal stress UspA family protein
MYEHIVVGTDGSDRATDAVERAAELAAAVGAAEIHVVSACQPMPNIELERLRRELPAEFRDVIDPEINALNHIALAERAAEKQHVKVVPHAMVGNAAEAILDVAADVDADLIVVGARGFGPIGRFLRGSVSTRVAHHAWCDVLIVEHD